MTSAFWDNLIPLKGGLFGQQLAGWNPGPPAKSGLGCRILADQRIEVAPDIELACDAYVPKRPGRYPAIVSFGAYSKELQAAGVPTGSNETGSPPIFTDRGYAHLIVTRRGMGRSDGDDAAYLNDTDVADHARVIQWAAAQPWCDGNLGMYGTSYSGFNSLQMARPVRSRSSAWSSSGCSPRSSARRNRDMAAMKASFSAVSRPSKRNSSPPSAKSAAASA